MYQQNCLRFLLPHFVDPAVAIVSGKVSLHNSNESYADPESYYYRFENWLKSMETKLGSTITADGAMLAIRRELVPSLPVDTVLDDFALALWCLRSGYKVRYEPGAVAWEESPLELSHELRRKSRIAAGTVQCMNWTFLLPFPSQWFVWWLFIGHKLIRWSMPFWLILLYALNLSLYGQDPLLDALFLLQSFLYAVALAAMVARPYGWNPLPTTHYVLASNLAVLWGLFRGLLNIQKPTWEKFSRTRERAPISC